MLVNYAEKEIHQSDIKPKFEKTGKLKYTCLGTNFILVYEYKLAKTKSCMQYLHP